MSAELVLWLLRDGSYRKHMEGLRARLAKAMSKTILRLRDIGLKPWIEPSYGMFVWCRLPDGCDAATIATRALAENVVLAPGNVFSLSQSASAFLRFNVAQCDDDRIFDVLRRSISG